MVTFRVDEDLRLVLQPAERLGVGDAVSVTFEGRAVLVGWLRTRPAARVSRADRDRGQPLGLLRLADRSVTPDEWPNH